MTTCICDAAMTHRQQKLASHLKHNIELNNVGNVAEALVMNWQDATTFPKNNNKIDVVIGSDLIYQSDMVPLLIDTLKTLAPARFLYTAPSSASSAATAGSCCRQGHDEFLGRLSDFFNVFSEQPAPADYTINPLVSGDDEECFLHFHELQSAEYTLYDFRWKNTATSSKS